MGAHLSLIHIYLLQLGLHLFHRHQHLVGIGRKALALLQVQKPQYQKQDALLSLIHICSVHAQQRGENAYRRPRHTVAYIGAEFWDSVKRCV